MAFTKTGLSHNPMLIVFSDMICLDSVEEINYD